MSSPKPFPSSSSSPSINQNHVTQEEFFAFHNIDRQLFSRLVFRLRREPSEAMQVVAFWLWLERTNRSLYVNKILNYSDSIILNIVEETMMAIGAAESDTICVSSGLDDIPILQSIVGWGRVNLRWFHENRILVLLGVGNLTEEVCLRAFRDIVNVILTSKGLASLNYSREHTYNPILGSQSVSSSTFTVDNGANLNNVISNVTQSSIGVIGDGRNRVAGVVSDGRNRGLGVIGDGRKCDGVGDISNNSNQSRSVSVHPSVDNIGDRRNSRMVQPPSPPPPPPLQTQPPFVANHNYGQEVIVYHPTVQVGDFSLPLHGTTQVVANGANSSNYPLTPNGYYQLEDQDNLMEMFAQMQMMNDVYGSQATIPSSERTIFLTFSKGYPISEVELRDFFLRSFGDIVETLYMQEVGGNEQPLYARLVVRDVIFMDVVLSGPGSKAKFAINGKHVWARKYVRKHDES